MKTIFSAAVVAIVNCVVMVGGSVVPADGGQIQERNEYCTYESFNVTCPPGSVLHILSARYGRMRMGRCVKVNLGYLGCGLDVTYVVAARCEARSQCALTVGDDDLRDTKPCPLDVTWYLEVTHTCVKVLTKDDVECRHHDVTSGGRDSGGGSKTAQTPGYIASTSGRISTSRSGGDGQGTGLVAVGDGSRGGHDECARWSLSVPAGQRIRLNLVRLLSRGSVRSSILQQQQRQQHWHADACLELGIVADGEQRLPLTGCTTQLLAASGSNTDDLSDKQQSNPAKAVVRQPTELPPVTTLYTSASDHISVSWTSTIMNDEQNDIVFLIQYEAIGCPYYRNPTRSWIQTVNYTRLIVHCNDSDTTWSVTCQDGRWEPSTASSNSCGGLTGSADRGRTKVWHEHLVDANSALPMSILIAVAVGVALGIFLGGVLLAVVGSRMNRRQKYRSNDVTSGYAASTLMTSDDDKMFRCSVSERQQPFHSCTLDVASRPGRSCCHQSEYSIPTATQAEITCLPPDMVDKSPSLPPLSLAAYCRPSPPNAYPSAHRGTGTFLRHEMYETYSP